MSSSQEESKILQNPLKWNFPPFFQTLGSVSSMPLRCPKFKNKKEKKTMCSPLRYLWKDGQTIRWPSKSNYYKPHRGYPRFKVALLGHFDSDMTTFFIYPGSGTFQLQHLDLRGNLTIYN